MSIPPPPPPTGGILSKALLSLWKLQLSFIHFLKLFALTEPPTPRKFQSPLWGEYGYFSGAVKFDIC